MSSPESKFLHDVANQLAIALGSIECVTEGDGALAARERERLQKALSALDRIRAMLDERRRLAQGPSQAGVPPSRLGA